jgi:signal transduction histidine kinase
LIDSQGVLWIGTFGGLNSLDLRTGVFARYQHDRDNPETISHNNITSLYLDSAGDLWVGTLAGGLNRFVSETETFTSYFEIAQQIGDAVLGITEGGSHSPDAELVLWLSTYQGLVKFSPEQGVLRVYDAADGLQGNTFNPSSLYRSKGGDLMFGGSNGFNIFSPDDLTSNLVVPPIVITAFNLNLEPVEIGEDSVLRQSITDLDTLKLSYNNRVISFEFSALSYTAPEKNEYRYRLENFEEDWLTVSSDRRFVSYTNLDPGEYIFRVIGSNSDGVWNEEGVSLRIVIVPPWWETWWFTTMVILAVVGGILFSIRYRIRSLENQRNLLEKLVDERTLEIHESNQKLGVLNQELEAFAYSVSHDLRAPLRALNGYNTILLEDHAANLDEEGREFIGRSLNAVDRMNMMIDAVLELSRMTRHDLEKLPLNLSAMAREHANELIEMDPERRVVWKIEPNIQIVGDRRVVMVVLENLIGNAWKFTRVRPEAVIEVGELDDNGRRVYFVRDNGIGFDASRTEEVFTLFQRTHSSEEYEGYGVGLAIVRRAVLKHGGKIWVESEIDKGTTFYFTL